MKKIILLISAFLVFSGGCDVGPQYEAQYLPKPDYSGVLSEGGKGSGVIEPNSLARWWRTLDDSILSDLIYKALENNKDIQAAKASLKQARAELGVTRASLFFQLDSSGSYTKSQASENTTATGGGASTDLYKLGLDAEWEIDIFGGNRKAVAAAEADVFEREENLRDVWVSLAAEVALNYIDLRTYQKRLKIARDNLKIQKETLELIKSRCQAGLSDELALQQANYNLETTRSTIPTLVNGLEKTKSNLAVLTGELATKIDESLEKTKPLAVSKIKKVIGIPANTLRRRPDVRSAELKIIAQTARVGEATADLYPKFNLVGSIGLESVKGSNLFMSESDAYSFGPSFSLPIFRAGSIRENIKAQTAVKEKYIAQYEKTILNSVKETKDALVAYSEQQKHRRSVARAVKAARAAQQIAQDKYKNGLSDFSNVLDAQRSLLEFQDKLAVSEGEIISNMVRLYKALGGGWQRVNTDLRN